MNTEGASMEIKKAMAYDLIDTTPDKERYTPEEIKALIKAYIAGTAK